MSDRARTCREAVRACALGLSLLASACAGATCPAQRITDPAEALRAQRGRNPPLRSLRAEAKIDQRGKQGRIKGRVLMFVERPDKVRFDAMTQFGPALILTSDGETFALTDFKENRYTTGEACAKNLARVVGVALSSADVASVLLGDAPLIAARSEALSCASGGEYVLAREGEAGAREELTFRVHPDDLAAPPARQRLFLTSATIWNAAGQRQLRVRYEDYRKVGGAELPHTLRIDDFVNDADALLRVQEAAVDVSVPEGAFAQRPGVGLKIEELACDP